MPDPSPGASPAPPAAPGGTSGEGTAPGAVQGAVATRLDSSTGALSDGSGGPDWPKPVDDHGAEANRRKLLGRWAPGALAAEDAAKGVPPPAAPAPAPAAAAPLVADPAAPAPAPVGSVPAPEHQVDPTILAAAQQFAPLIQQLQAQGYTSADAVQAAYAEQSALAQHQSAVGQRFQQYKAEVDAGKMEPGVAERLFNMEAQAMDREFQANRLIRQTMVQTQSATIASIRQAYPSVPADTVQALVTANPMTAQQIAGQIHAAIQAEVSRQVTVQAGQAQRQQQLAPARAAATPGGAPAAAPAGAQAQQGSNWNGWLNHMRGLGMKLPGRT